MALYTPPGNAKEEGRVAEGFEARGAAGFVSLAATAEGDLEGSG